jgi:uncharacterized membrane protein
MKGLLLLSLFTTSLLSAAPTPPRPPTRFEERMSELKIRAILIPAQACVVYTCVWAYNALIANDRDIYNNLDSESQAAVVIENVIAHLGLVAVIELILSTNQKNSGAFFVPFFF